MASTMRPMALLCLVIIAAIVFPLANAEVNINVKFNMSISVNGDALDAKLIEEVIAAFLRRGGRGSTDKVVVEERGDLQDDSSPGLGVGVVPVPSPLHDPAPTLTEELNSLIDRPGPCDVMMMTTAESPLRPTGSEYELGHVINQPLEVPVVPSWAAWTTAPVWEPDSAAWELWQDEEFIPFTYLADDEEEEIRQYGAMAALQEGPSGSRAVTIAPVVTSPSTSKSLEFEMTGHETRVRELESELASMAEARDGLAARLEAARQAMEEMTVSRSDLDGRAKGLEAEVEALQAKCEALRQEQEARLMGAEEKLEAERVRLQIKEAEAIARCQQAEEATASLQLRNTQLEAKLRGMQAAASDASADSQSPAEALAASLAQSEAMLEEKTVEMEETIMRLEGELMEVEQERDQVVIAKASLGERLRDVEASLDRSVTGHETHVREPELASVPMQALCDPGIFGAILSPLVAWALLGLLWRVFMAVACSPRWRIAILAATLSWTFLENVRGLPLVVPILLAIGCGVMKRLLPHRQEQEDSQEVTAPSRHPQEELEKAPVTPSTRPQDELEVALAQERGSSEPRPIPPTDLIRRKNAKAHAENRMGMAEASSCEKGPDVGNSMTLVDPAPPKEIGTTISEETPHATRASITTSIDGEHVLGRAAGRGKDEVSGSHQSDGPADAKAQRRKKGKRKGRRGGKADQLPAACEENVVVEEEVSKASVPSSQERVAFLLRPHNREAWVAHERAVAMATFMMPGLMVLEGLAQANILVGPCAWHTQSFLPVGGGKGKGVSAAAAF